MKPIIINDRYKCLVGREDLDEARKNGVKWVEALIKGTNTIKLIDIRRIK